MKISVVTVTRNAAVHLAACLDSVANQTHPDVEHVIVDGMSTDGTGDLVAAQGKRAVFVSEPDSGIYDAMNKGVQRATGDYIIFLGADDFLHDERVLADVSAFLEREGRPDWIYGDLHVRASGKAPSIFRPPPPSEALAFLICGCLPHQSTVARRDALLKKIGPFDTRYRIHGDYEWFLRALATDGAVVKRFERVIGSFYLGGVSSHLERGQQEVYAIQERYAPYNTVEWLGRRVSAFQQELLRYRVASAGVPGPSLWDRAVRRIKRAAAGGKKAMARAEP